MSFPCILCVLRCLPVVCYIYFVRVLCGLFVLCVCVFKCALCVVWVVRHVFHVCSAFAVC